MPDLFDSWTDMVLLAGIGVLLFELNDLKKKIAALGTAIAEIKGGKPG